MARVPIAWQTFVLLDRHSIFLFGAWSSPPVITSVDLQGPLDGVLRDDLVPVFCYSTSSCVVSLDYALI